LFLNNNFYLDFLQELPLPLLLEVLPHLLPPLRQQHLLRRKLTPLTVSYKGTLLHHRHKDFPITPLLLTIY
jgi:hypothetical protein